MVVREADWFRSYSSDLGSWTYFLPGYQIHAGVGTFSGSRIERSFVVPKLDYPDTLIVPNGSYVRVDSSAWLSVLAWQGAQGYGSRLKGIPLGEEVATTDSSPPLIELYADGIRLSETDTVNVPNSFTLTGVLEDESGVLLARVADYGLSFYVGSSVGERVDLTGAFNYDNNSVTRGRFEWPVDIEQEHDSLTLIVSDNLRNRCFCTFRVATDLVAALKLDSCLVYPNPVGDRAFFTFELSRAAFVTIKVYTIAGRLVRQLPDQLCGFGYNQVEWDGRDRDGVDLASGVYLYKIDARSAETSSGLSYSTSYRGKLLVRH